MKHFIRLAVVALGLVIAAPLAPAAHAQDAACAQALTNLTNARSGKNDPVGIEADGLRLKPKGSDYTAADEAAFIAAIKAAGGSVAPTPVVTPIVVPMHAPAQRT